MNGDIKLSAPGGLPGDIWLDTSSASLSAFSITGRVVSLDGSPRSGISITVFERRSLTLDVVLATVTTDARGGYTCKFSLPQVAVSDVFVEANDQATSELVKSPLLGHLLPGSHVVDLVLGTGTYTGRSEWERITDKLDSLLDTTLPQDVPADRLEWLATRADIFPLHLAAYIQGHRLAEGRTVKPETCFAFLRGGLAADLLGLLRAGASSWENALRTAWTRDILPQPGDGSVQARDLEVTNQIAAMRELLVDAAVVTPISGINQRVIFDTAGLSEAQQRTFAELWINNTGTLDDFWTTVAGSSLGAEVPLLKFTINAAIVAGNHVETLAALQSERAALSISTIADTASWSVSDWDNVLVTRTVTAPDKVPGSTATEKRQNYARALFNIVEDGHPSLSLRHSLAREASAPPNTDHLTTYLTNNPDFDIVSSTVAVYLDGATSPWTGIDPLDQEQARKNLETVQRVYRVTPRIGRYAATKVLLDQGITSASQIAQSTKTEFVTTFGALFSNDDHHAEGLAEAVWDNATQINATAIALVSQFALAKSKADPTVIGVKGAEQFAGESNGLASLETILGNLDYCSCEHCRSVFSPAAYLADLLMFLQDRGALDVLDARRPDIKHILLDCDNSNTVLPYIDLVNEALEAYVLNAGTLPDSSSQTTWQANELRLHPEHMDPSAYDSPPPLPYTTNLTTLLHPWTLPFSLPTVEARTYLQHLGVPRSDLMRRYLPRIPDATEIDAIAGDVLGMSAEEFRIVSGQYGPTPSGDNREFWGFSSVPADDLWLDALAGFDPNRPGLRNILNRGGYALDELRELLKLDYINPGGTMQLQFLDTCDLDDASISFLTVAAVDRIHRFTRLQRACKIPTRMLNVLLVDALGGILDRDALLSLADAVRLNERLRLDWDVLATFWAQVIDARDYTSGARSLYYRGFLAKDLGSSQPFTPNGSVLIGEPDAIATMSPEPLTRILAGIGASEAEYRALVDAGLATGEFTFANLTALFRATAFARAIKISIADLARVAGASGFTGEQPFTAPSQTLHFVELIDGVRATGFTIPELDWLLRHEFDDVDPLDAEEVGRTLAGLARGLTAIEEEAKQLVEVDISILKTNLAKIINDTTDLDDAIAIIDQSTVLDDTAQQSFIDTKFASFVDTAEAKAALVGTDEITDLQLRITWLLGRVVAHLRRRAFINDTIAANFEIPATVADVLVNDVLTDPSNGPQRLFEVFRMPFATEEEIVNNVLDGGTHAGKFVAWTRVAKAAMLCQRFDLRGDEAVWYFDEVQTAEWMDLDDLPLEAVDADVAFSRFDDLRRALEIRDLSKPDSVLLQEIAAAADFASAINVLADHAGWDAPAVAAVATTLGYDSDTPAQLAHGDAVYRLRKVVEAADRFGVPATMPTSWAAATPSSTEATAIRLATRAKYGESRWREIAAPLRDVIRERQRDALLDAAIAINEQFDSGNDVFEHLLIDVEMSHCMMTSRIKQAISSVQIFIHRVFLHLESVKFDSEAIARWDWMKNYRVWEANRKVFLYPENWIEPELRSNKTPEFEALEANLLQGVLEKERVEKALEIYLDKLDRVSSMEIIGVYDSFDDIWVLGRTHAEPYEWFVRRRTTAGAWGKWEQVPVEMEGDAIALTVIDNRLHLFWVTSQDRQHTFRPIKNVSVKGSVEEKYIEAEYGDPVPGVVYRLAHVQRSAHGEWTKTQMSESEVEVAFGKPPRLQVWKTDDGIGLAVMTEWPTEFSYITGDFVEPWKPQPAPESFIFLRAAFYYSILEDETYYLGSSFAADQVIRSVEVYLSLKDWEIVTFEADDMVAAYGLDVFEHIDIHPLSVSYIDGAVIGKQPPYNLRGQRYEFTQYREGFGAEVTANGVVDHLIEIRKPSEQGSDIYLFARPTKHGIPAFVEQADYWEPKEQSALFPVVYDDRKRKFLLIPRQEWSSHGGGGGDAVPLDNFKVESFFLCPSDDSTAGVLPLAPARNLTRRVRDRVRQSGVFTNKIPGGSGGADLGFYYGGALQAQAETLVNEEAGLDVDYGNPGGAKFKFQMELVYHPYSKLMVGALAKLGVRGLYAASVSTDLFRQMKHDDPFSEEDLNPALVDPYRVLSNFPREEFDFAYDSAYGIYNWELFYHTPMLIAGKLAAEQRWDDAQKWYHYIFNPIDLVDEQGASRFWRMKRFVGQAQELAKSQLQAMLGIGVSSTEQAAATEAFSAEVSKWQQNPFDPHAVARIRPGVYQRALIRKYFDNLVAWGDNLFRRDTMESIAEATVLYILVAQLLGPRPTEVPGTEIASQSFQDFITNGGLDKFSNAVIELENYVVMPTTAVQKKGCGPALPDQPWVRIPVVSRFWYFCYPPNPELLKYWSIIEDRLFKIRNCRNIDGVERTLPLFEPPIDPALLVQATAAGVDIQSVLAELNSGLPPYRFRSVHARAAGFSASLKALGSALLSALEKQDGEELALIRSQHERDLLGRVRDVRVQHAADARAALMSLEAARAIAEDRRQHYANLVSVGLSEGEERQFEFARKGQRMRNAAQAHTIVAGLLSLIPQLSMSAAPSVEIGGVQFSAAVRAHSEVFAYLASGHDFESGKATQKAMLDRRAEDWKLQESQAEKEITRIDRDIIGAKIRVQIAERELDNHDSQVEHAREVDMFMRSRFTNKELYDWMVRELSTMYFQSYQLAFDLAKRAERAYRHELAIENTAPIIKYGYWDSLSKGLLAGEKLVLDLERLELAYMDRDEREFELRKSVSLAQLNPGALQDLQENGFCAFALPELLFDLDHPGHYLRRIRAIRLTIPAVVGPYTSLGARLQLDQHKTRNNTALLLPGDVYEEQGDDHGRFRYGTGSGQSIATSTAIQDGGLFNLDFRDERYLPFEYAGAISSWILELPSNVRQFDYRTISDVVIHVDYTARDGGSTLRTAAQGAAASQLTSALEGQELKQLFVVHDAFPNEWEQFFSAAGDPQVLSLPITLSHFPYFAQREGVVIKQVRFTVLLDEDVVLTEPNDTLPVSFSLDGNFPDLTLEGAYLDGVSGSLTATPGTWTLSVAESAEPAPIRDNNRLDRSKIQGLVMTVSYTLVS